MGLCDTGVTRMSPALFNRFEQSHFRWRLERVKTDTAATHHRNLSCNLPKISQNNWAISVHGSNERKQTLGAFYGYQCNKFHSSAWQLVPWIPTLGLSFDSTPVEILLSTSDQNRHAGWIFPVKFGGVDSRCRACILTWFGYTVIHIIIVIYIYM